MTQSNPLPGTKEVQNNIALRHCVVVLCLQTHEETRQRAMTTCRTRQQRARTTCTYNVGVFTPYLLCRRQPSSDLLTLPTQVPPAWSQCGQCKFPDKSKSYGNHTPVSCVNLPTFPIIYLIGRNFTSSYVLRIKREVPVEELECQEAFGSLGRVASIN